jgi:hypothetical protein
MQYSAIFLLFNDGAFEGQLALKFSQWANSELADKGNGLRGFELADPDGYILFFGRP